MGKLSLGVLGTFEASLDGCSLRSFRTRSVQALLIYLATQPETAQRREHLMALLWPGLPQKSAQANLRQTLYLLRQAIPEVGSKGKGETVPLLLADRNTVRVNSEATFELDAARFESLLAGPLENWPAAVDLYRGDFLEGFYLPDSPDFDAWVLARRELYRRRVLDALERLAQNALDDGEPGAAETYARRQVEIDDLRESGHRLLMQALASSGKRTDALTQYNTLRELLAEELAAEPSADTSSLYVSILSGETEPAGSAEPAVTETRPVDLVASFPISGSAPPRPLFVGRQRQIAWLDDHLQRVLDGQTAGNVVFVAGEAGMGKTSLMQAFAGQATQENQDLLVAWGTCNAFIGPGDAYLPIRQVLDLLAGDVEGAWRSGTITTEQARRLWAGYPDFGQAAVDYGWMVTGTLVDGRSLLKRGRATFPQGTQWLARLERIVDNVDGGQTALSENRLHQGFVDLLADLADRTPLLLLLDDLQWADSASLNLLFHLDRSLAGYPVLIVGAYRPEEVSLGRGGEKHPLERVVAEIRHLSGDAVLDLGESESVERRAFIDALLDSEANTLDESFRQALFAHTGGQALFTVEILRYLQDRGDIFQEEDGAWTADKTLAWDALPDRVEGVIEARIGRLEDELRELLNVAAVEGEEFTAQVVARVQAIDERGLLKMLSNQLDKKHQLVRESSALKHGRHLLSRYRFSHTLFQQYLYNDLSQSERQLLHGDIAAILEELYEGRTDEIAVLLARHYRAAGEDDRALPYLLQSGDQARGLYAFEQATQYYGDALQILRRDGDPDTVYQLLMKLAQTYHSVFEYDRSAELYREAFQYSEVGANPPTNKKPSASLRRVRCELRYIGQPFQTLDYADTTSAHDHLFITHLFSGLLQTSPNLDVLPDIAASWQISDDGLTYTFFLRDDVVWSDGQPVTAHDFEFAWRRVLDRRRSSPNTGLLADLRGATNFLAGESARLGIRALDNWTLQINLERPAAYFLHLLSHFGFPLPRHVVEAHGDDWWAIANLVTNGPFVLERLPLEWCAGESVLLRRNPAYHGWFPGNLDQIELPIFSSTSGSLREYENNKLDLMPIGGWWGRSRLPISEYRRVLQIHGPEVHTFPQLSTAMVVFDTSRPPFDDVRVRRAFARAADRQSFAGDRLEVASGGLVPPGLPGHVADIALPYDVDEAKRLLAKAGYPAGRGFPPVKGALHESLKDTIGFFDRVWCDVLDVTVRWEPAKDVVMAPIEPYALVLLAWSADYPDPDNFLRFFLRNSSNWSNDTYDRLLEEASRTMVQRERLRLYRQAEQILVEEVPVLPLVYGQTEWLVKPWIKNWRPGHFMSLSTQYIMVEPH